MKRILLIIIAILPLALATAEADIEQYIWIGFQTMPPPLKADGSADMSAAYMKWWKKGPTLFNTVHGGTIWVNGYNSEIIVNKMIDLKTGRPVAATN